MMLPLAEPDPARPPVAPPDKRFVTLGTVCLVLGLLEILYALQKVSGTFAVGPLLELEKRLLAAAPHPVPVGPMLSAVQGYTARIAPWESLRMVPFVAASGVLVWIGLRLRKGDASALKTARAWSFWALGVVALSVVAQMVLILPATLDYQRQLVTTMPPMPAAGSAAPPFDLGLIVSTVTVVSTLAGMVFGTVGSATWPVVLRIWAGRLQRPAA